MVKIKKVYAREILDSRGIPTVETKIYLDDGTTGVSSVATGAQQEKFSAVQIRDGDEKRFSGLGVLKAVENVNTVIANGITGLDPAEQAKIDRTMIELDGTPNKSKLGANAILSVSQAVAKAAANSYKIPLYKYLSQFALVRRNQFSIPIPMFNIVEGGKHATGNYGFQEFLAIPASSKNYREGLETIATLFLAVKKTMIDKGMPTLVADEGGYSPGVASNQETLNLIKQSFEYLFFNLSLDVFLGIDCAANEFRINNVYKLTDRSAPYESADLLEFYKSLISDFSIIYLEDPYATDDIDAWTKLYNGFSSKLLIASDDLVCSNPFRLQSVIDGKISNSVVVKPTQAGTILESIAVCQMIKYKNLKLVVSGRSGETTDDFVADFSVAVGADYVKFGAPDRERLAKYNRLLDIYEENGGK